MLDAQLLAEKYSKVLGVVMHAEVETLSPMPLGSFIEKIFPELRFDEHEPLKQDDPNLCLMLSTNSMFDVKGAKNHWCPCWFVSQLPSDFHLEATIMEDKRIESKLDELGKSLDELEAEDIPSLDPSEETLRFSAICDVKGQIEKFPSC